MNEDNYISKNHTFCRNWSKGPKDIVFVDTFDDVKSMKKLTEVEVYTFTVSFVDMVNGKDPMSNCLENIKYNMSKP